MTRTLVLGLVLGAAVMASPAPVAAQSFGDALSGIAKSLLAQELDRNAFAEAQRANSIAAYQDYLARFPDGLHRADAQAALKRLGVAQPAPVMPLPGQPAPVMPLPASPAQLEAAIGLSRDQRAVIQRQLTLMGFDTRGADGLWGSNTRTAIARWQGANRQEVTGYFTRLQVDMLARQAAERDQATRPPVLTPESIEKAMELSAPERREIQLRLTLLGHSTQGTNGTFGPLTRRAIEAWQRSEKLTVTGYLNEDQVRRLQRQTGG